MADEEQVRRLTQGVAEWNAWRERVPFAAIDLTGTPLNDANLSGVNLSGTDLGGADLAGAHLSGADLSGADLSGADLSGADLSGADLSGTYLVAAHLSGPDVTGADLSGAILLETIFADVDLSNTIGLEVCEHWGRSVIDFRTLAKSKSLPLTFLRGVGLPDTLIDYLPSLLNQAIQYYSCFISYSSKDDDFAKRLHSDLQNNGVRCWFAPHDMRIGEETRDAIDRAIRVRDKVLLVLSENSIESDWVEDEVDAAFEEERKSGHTVLFPIRLDTTVMTTEKVWAAKLRRARHIGDFEQWKDHDSYQRSLERVLRDLKPAGKNEG